MQTASPALGPSVDRRAGSHYGMSHAFQVGRSPLGLSRACPGPVLLRPNVSARTQGPDAPQEEARGPAMATPAKVSRTPPESCTRDEPALASIRDGMGAPLGLHLDPTQGLGRLSS